ncbi:unnamed protein product [Paramecium primaurelia]|uniref:Uncharacterized protein n=1 Tax=Paramecium primaurelia TaxID=5886 RepID=A0A8S1KJ25_PARPR|nr:unnamed protein product [Paramecium primaurelia]
MEIHQLLVVMITLSAYGMQRQDKKLNHLIKTTKIFLHNLKYHFRIAHYYQMIFVIYYYLFEPDRTILRICQNPLLEAQGTLILQGEFINHQGKYLKPFFKSKGGCLLETIKNFDIKKKEDCIVY